MQRTAILGAITLLLLTSSAHGQSIWRRHDPSMTSLVGDTAARRVGDLVTIVIRENTDVDNRDQRQMQKATDSSFNTDFAATGDLGSGAGTFDFANESDRNFNGRTQYTVEQAFTDRITVPVIDVLPNGNLVLGGRRERLIGGEIRTLVVSGTVRAVDIGPNNTIPSHLVSHFKVCYEGSGPESAFSGQGWGGRLMNKLWPF